MAVELFGNGCRVWIPHALTDADGNADVHIFLHDAAFAGTLYTVDSIRELMARHERTGECASGRYFFDPTMVIVRNLRPETILAVAEELVKSGELSKAFAKSV